MNGDARNRSFNRPFSNLPSRGFCAFLLFFLSRIELRVNKIQCINKCVSRSSAYFVIRIVNKGTELNYIMASENDGIFPVY